MTSKLKDEQILATRQGLQECAKTYMLREMELPALEAMRKAAQTFLARSESYVRIRLQQGMKAQLNKRT